jgi:nondiscriminating aspartyl-tRNA synthetase
MGGRGHELDFGRFHFIGEGFERGALRVRSSAPLPAAPERLTRAEATVATPAEMPVVDFAEVRTGSEDDLSPADERRICGEYGELVFVQGFPTAKRPFYTHPDPARPEFSRGFDLLFRGLEIVTGGQRLHRYDDYLAALAARGTDPAPFGGYLEAFRYGMPPHGGFALGLERWTAQLLGLRNVRETTLFPRDRNRVAP